jgi:hypothetical protein
MKMSNSGNQLNYYKNRLTNNGMYQPIQGNKKNIKNLTANNLELNGNNRNSKAATIKNALQKKKNGNLIAKMNSNPNPTSTSKPPTSNASTSTNNNTNTLIVKVNKIINNNSKNNNIINNNISKFIDNFKNFKNTTNLILTNLDTQLTTLKEKYNTSKGNLKTMSAQGQTKRPYQRLKKNVATMGIDLSSLSNAKKELENLLDKKTINFKDKTSAYLKSTFIEPITQKKTNLNGLLAALVTINKTLTTTLGKNDVLTNNNIQTITNAYKNFTNKRQKINNTLKNTDLKNNFISLQKNLKNLEVNVTNTNKAFTNFKNIFAKQVINNLATNQTSVNSAFKNRIQTINTSILKKTEILTEIVNKISSQIKELNTYVNNKALNTNTKNILGNLIKSMTNTIKDMSSETNLAQNALLKIMNTLSSIINKNYTAKTLNELLGTNKSKLNNSKNTGNGSSSIINAVKSQKHLATTGNALLGTTLDINNTINKKASTILKNKTNKQLPVTFTTQEGNINGTIKKNSDGKITYLNNKGTSMVSKNIKQIYPINNIPSATNSGERSAAASTQIINQKKKIISNLDNKNIEKQITYSTKQYGNKTAKVKRVTNRHIFLNYGNGVEKQINKKGPLKNKEFQFVIKQNK